MTIIRTVARQYLDYTLRCGKISGNSIRWTTWFIKGGGTDNQTERFFPLNLIKGSSIQQYIEIARLILRDVTFSLSGRAATPDLPEAHEL